jgi:hypothetical protein
MEREKLKGMASMEGGRMRKRGGARGERGKRDCHWPVNEEGGSGGWRLTSR